MLVESYRHSPPPHGASAPFWAPYSVCPSVAGRSGELTVPLCCMRRLGLELVLGRKMACGRAEAGPPGAFMEEVAGESAVPRLRLSADASGPLRVPGSPPTPAPGMFFTPARLPKGRPLGDATAPPPSLGARERAIRAGRLGSSLSSSQGEIPPRSPQALGSQNNLRGKGGCGGREAGGAQSRAAGCLQVPLRERTPGEEGLWEAGAPSTSRSPGSSASPGSPSALPRL